MKKILLLFIMAVSVHFANAQIRYNVVAGVNASTTPGLPNYFQRGNGAFGQTYSSSVMIGYHAGAFADYLIRKVSIQAGLLYTTKGGISHSDGSTNTTNNSRKDKSRLNYIEIPINVLYHMPIKTSDFFFGGGPYVGYGISGKDSYQQSIQDFGPVSVSKGDADPFKVTYNSTERFDYGLGAKAGIVFKDGYLISLTYEHGINDIVDGGARYSGRNQVLSLSFGYSFK